MLHHWLVIYGQFEIISSIILNGGRLKVDQDLDFAFKRITPFQLMRSSDLSSTDRVTVVQCEYELASRKSSQDGAFQFLTDNHTFALDW